MRRPISTLVVAAVFAALATPPAGAAQEGGAAMAILPDLTHYEGVHGPGAGIDGAPVPERRQPASDMERAGERAPEPPLRPGRSRGGVAALRGRRDLFPPFRTRHLMAHVDSG